MISESRASMAAFPGLPSLAPCAVYCKVVSSHPPLSTGRIHQGGNCPSSTISGESSCPVSRSHSTVGRDPIKGLNFWSHCRYPQTNREDSPLPPKLSEVISPFED